MESKKRTRAPAGSVASGDDKASILAAERAASNAQKPTRAAEDHSKSPDAAGGPVNRRTLGAGADGATPAPTTAAEGRRSRAVKIEAPSSVAKPGALSSLAAERAVKQESADLDALQGWASPLTPLTPLDPFFTAGGASPKATTLMALFRSMQQQGTTGPRAPPASALPGASPGLQAPGTAAVWATKLLMGTPFDLGGQTSRVADLNLDLAAAGEFDAALGGLFGAAAAATARPAATAAAVAPQAPAVSAPAMPLYKGVHCDRERGVWQVVVWNGERFQVVAEYGSEQEALAANEQLSPGAAAAAASARTAPTAVVPMVGPQAVNGGWGGAADTGQQEPSLGGSRGSARNVGRATGRAAAAGRAASATAAAGRAPRRTTSSNAASDVGSRGVEQESSVVTGGSSRGSRGGGSGGVESKYRGVSWWEKSHKWRSQYWDGAKLVCIGFFDVEEDAARAYDVALCRQGRRDSGLLNFAAANYADVAVDPVLVSRLAQCPIQPPKPKERVTSQYKGVSWNSACSKWVAVLWDRELKRARHIGSYESEVDAAKAYDREAMKMLGPDAGLNFRDSAADYFAASGAAAPAASEGAAGSAGGGGGAGSKGSSQYRGVSWHDRSARWEVRVWGGGKQHFIGSFTSELEAARSYDKAVLRLRGQDARSRSRMNFPISDYDLDEIAREPWPRDMVRDDGRESSRGTAGGPAHSLQRSGGGGVLGGGGGGYRTSAASTGATSRDTGRGTRKRDRDAAGFGDDGDGGNNSCASNTFASGLMAPPPLPFPKAPPAAGAGNVDSAAPSTNTSPSAASGGQGAAPGAAVPDSAAAKLPQRPAGSTVSGGSESSGRRGGASSKYRGVSLNKADGRWVAQIWDAMLLKPRTLGSYADEEEAARAYDKEVVRTKGADAAGTNFPASQYLDEAAAFLKSQHQKGAVAAAPPATANSSGKSTPASGFASTSISPASLGIELISPDSMEQALAWQCAANFDPAALTFSRSKPASPVDGTAAAAAAGNGGYLPFDAAAATAPGFFLGGGVNDLPVMTMTAALGGATLPGFGNATASATAVVAVQQHADPSAKAAAGMDVAGYAPQQQQDHHQLLRAGSNSVTTMPSFKTLAIHLPGGGLQQQPLMPTPMSSSVAMNATPGFAQPQRVQQQAANAARVASVAAAAAAAPGSPMQTGGSGGSAQKKTLYRGVSWDAAAGSWRASIWDGGSQRVLGHFATELEAARAYDTALIAKQGSEARTNLPLSEYGLAAAAPPAPSPLGSPTWSELGSPRKTNASSQFKGVSLNKHSGKWECRLRQNGKNLYLGSYEIEVEAAKAFDRAVLTLRGPETVTNFPPDSYSPEELAEAARNLATAHNMVPGGTGGGGDNAPASSPKFSPKPSPRRSPATLRTSFPGSEHHTGSGTVQVNFMAGGGGSTAMGADPLAGRVMSPRRAKMQHKTIFMPGCPMLQQGMAAPGGGDAACVVSVSRSAPPTAMMTAPKSAGPTAHMQQTPDVCIPGFGAFDATALLLGSGSSLGLVDIPSSGGSGGLLAVLSNSPSPAGDAAGGGSGRASRFRGVAWSAGSKRWRAQVNLGDRVQYIGYYETEEEAARAYDMTVLKLAPSAQGAADLRTNFSAADYNILTTVPSLPATAPPLDTAASVDAPEWEQKAATASAKKTPYIDPELLHCWNDWAMPGARRSMLRVSPPEPMANLDRDSTAGSPSGDVPVGAGLPPFAIAAPNAGAGVGKQYLPHQEMLMPGAQMPAARRTSSTGTTGDEMTASGRVKRKAPGSAAKSWAEVMEDAEAKQRTRRTSITSGGGGGGGGGATSSGTLNPRRTSSTGGPPATPGGSRRQSSGYRGVTWHVVNEKWICRIREGDTSRHMGCYNTEVEAARAYDVAAILMRGPGNGVINFPLADYVDASGKLLEQWANSEVFALMEKTPKKRCGSRTPSTIYVKPSSTRGVGGGGSSSAQRELYASTPSSSAAGGMPGGGDPSAKRQRRESTTSGASSGGEPACSGGKGKGKGMMLAAAPTASAGTASRRPVPLSPIAERDQADGMEVDRPAGGVRSPLSPVNSPNNTATSPPGDTRAARAARKTGGRGSSGRRAGANSADSDKNSP